MTDETGEILARLAHDVKSPLTAIVGFAELLEEGVLQGAEASDAAHTIRSNARRIEAMLEAARARERHARDDT